MTMLERGSEIGDGTALLPFDQSAVALNGGLVRVIESIISILEDETDALKHNRWFDMATMNMRKARLLHDYSSTVRGIDPRHVEPLVRGKLVRMRTALEQNMNQCRAHSAAVREIVTIVMEAECERHNDGTYSFRRNNGV
jgi:uncharacterized protein with HEPN domain